MRERRRQRELASARASLTSAEFVERLIQDEVDRATAQFVWDELQPYYFEPLAPDPLDRPVSEFRIDPDDLSDIVTAFERKFGRRWGGSWVGPDDPTLVEFAIGLLASTSPE